MGSKGYTFVEVLIASLIFSIIVALATLAFTQGINQYEGIIRRSLNFSEEIKFFLLYRSIVGIKDYFVEDEQNDWFPYFIGRDDLISYVSLSPLSYEVPVVVFLEKKQDSAGKFSLLYYEFPVYTLNYKELEKTLTFREYQRYPALILLSGLEELKFSYYTYDPIKKTWVWSFEHNENNYYLPRMLKIDYLKNGERVHLFFGIYIDIRKDVYYGDILEGEEYNISEEEVEEDK